MRKKNLYTLLLVSMLLVGCGSSDNKSQETSSSATSSSISESESISEASSEKSEEISSAEQSSEEISSEQSEELSSEELSSEELSSEEISEESSKEISSSSSATPSSSSYDNSLEEPPTYDEPSLSIHYHRDDGAYTNKWDLWIWPTGGEGAAFTFNGIDDFGAVAAYPLSAWANSETVGIGMIIRTYGSWSKQTSDIKINFNDYEMDDNQIYHLYFEQGENTIYDGNIYTSPNTEGVSVAEFTSFRQVKVVGSKEISKVVLKENGKEIASKLLESPSKTTTIALDEDASFENAYLVEVTFFASGAVKEKGVNVNKLYNTDEFRNNYTYDGDDLGVTRNATSTTFKVWSPVSSEIKVRVYASGTPVKVSPEFGDDTYTEYDMVRGEKGVWSATVNADLAGTYYTYVVTNSNFTEAEVVDPYAKSAGISGLRGMVVDFDQTNPANWEDVHYLKYDKKELTVYEMHVADVTSHSSWTGNEVNRRKYRGLVEPNTTYTKNGKTVATGFDHIKEFGVNAVQLLPIYDQANDETSYKFNWGYNPLNYNVVEGMYSANPYDGYERIRELKEVVKGFNEAGIEVIMDVVYNHVNSVSNLQFDVLMPGYYFRYNSDGSLSNGSGCGNETASEMPMMRKYMIDSTEFWMKEYKLGGFRFDLMGLHDLTTMNELTANLLKINDHAAIYGEPWTGGTSAMPNFEKQSAKQSNANSYVGYGQFNDMQRDALIKSGMNAASTKGWVTNEEKVAKADALAIAKGITGSTFGNGYEIADPNKTVNYVTCHDNYALFDRMYFGLQMSDIPTIMKMALLSEAVTFTSAGTTFMQGGEEFLRTKRGNHNSYEAGDQYNQFNYSQLITFRSEDMTDYYQTFRKLINFKQNVAALHTNNCSDITVTQLDNGATMMYELGQFLVIHTNGVPGKAAIDLEGTYQVTLDTLGLIEEGTSLASVTPEPFQTLILRK